MPDSKNNLFIFEAVSLRDQYDAHIALLQNLLEVPVSQDRFSNDSETKKNAEGFDQKQIETTLKKLQVKRLKLNQEIQTANFTVKIGYEGENISIAEALGVRKALRTNINELTARVNDAAFHTVIHKEERDIVSKSRYSFSESYSEFLEEISKLRKLEGLIHTANHTNTVAFKDEQ
jgi:hypothetical protein